jgi:Ca-activated chloride channel family protein
MHARRAWLLGLALAITAAVAGSLAEARSAKAGQQPVFRAETDLVTVGVTVRDRSGTPITDLSHTDFTVTEDGRAQTVTYFARGDQENGAVETHVGLLLDTSGSMGADIELARKAAVRFLNTIRDAVDMTLVDFDTEVRVARYTQQDFPRMVERIRSRRQLGAETAFYDALGVYLDGAADADGRTLLVIFTDGGDTRSAIPFKDIMDLLRATDVTVYAVGFLEHQPSSVRNEQRLRLTQMAEETGGEAIFPLSMKEIESAYDRVVAGIRAQYTLGYTSTNTARDGRWRRVEVKVARSGDSRGRALRVLTRKGYFAPYVK